MSLILDALKKLDREKSSRRDGNANIAAGILRPAPPRPGRKNRLYVVAVSLSALAAAGVTYAVMEYGSPQKTQTTGPGPAAAQSPAPAKQQAAAVLPAPEPARGVRPDAKPPEKVQAPVERKGQPVSPALLAKTASPAAARAAAAPSPPPGASPLPSREQTPPARDSREAAPAAPVKNQNPPEIKAAPPPAEKAPARKAAPEAPAVVPAAPMKPADAAPATPAGDPPSLKLSGIVWHEEPAARRAVVNGTFAAEGSVVEGVKVVEIHPNRVAFSHNGRPFEIVMFR